ncbi:MAG: sulfatase-like hydrolase/transferase, partial [Verrucomicrobiales bacterium]
FLGCTGHPLIQTPVIDKLAADGVRFENAFVTTSICAASRASLLTGLYERTHGYTFGKPKLSAANLEDSYPSQLRKAGYRTGFIGKFGVGVPRGATAAMFDSFVPLNRNPYFHKQPDGSLRHETEVAGDRAIEFLRGAEGDGRPFCLSVSFNASHAEDGDKVNHFPFPKAVAKLYEGMVMPPPRHADPKTFESQPEFLRKSMNRDRYFWRWDTPEKYQHNMRNYLRMISGIDGVIGRVQAQLGELGLADNTIIIYMADNGYYAGSRGFAGKWSHYEESLRVPLIIMDPRSEPSQRGVVRQEMALNVDIAPTLLSYASAELPQRYQGVPLTGEIPRRDFFCEHLMDNASIPKWEGVRDRRYVYARYFEQDPPFEFLHDLQQDPDEFVNLAADPASAAILKSMQERCDDLRDTYTQAATPPLSVEKLVERAQQEAGRGDLAAAAESVGLAIRQQPDLLLHRSRAQIFSQLGQHKRAVADYSAAIKLAGDDAELVADLHQSRGVERFFDAQIEPSVADFDA